jgi:hypothetical protein
MSKRPLIRAGGILFFIVLIATVLHISYIAATIKNVSLPRSLKLFSTNCDNGAQILLEQDGKYYGSPLFDIEHSSGEELWFNLWYVQPSGNRVPFETRDIPDPTEGYNFNAVYASKAPTYIPSGQSLVVDNRGLSSDLKDSRVINLRISHVLLSLEEYNNLQFCFAKHSSEIVAAIRDEEYNHSFNGWLANSIGILYYDNGVY